MTGKKKNKPLSPWAVIRQAMGLRKKKKKKKKKRNGSKVKLSDIFRMLPASLFRRKQDPRRIMISPQSFTQNGGISKWYSTLRSTMIHRIDIRKDKSLLTFRHEFAVVYLTDGTVYRFDHRPDLHISTLIGDVLDGCPAEDSMTPVTTSELGELEEKSYFIERVNFQPSSRPDIISIISFTLYLCSNRHTKKYEMGRLNCYFFTHSIVKFISFIRHKPIQNFQPSHYINIITTTVKSMLKHALYVFDSAKRGRVRNL